MTCSLRVGRWGIEMAFAPIEKLRRRNFFIALIIAHKEGEHKISKHVKYCSPVAHLFRPWIDTVQTVNTHLFIPWTVAGGLKKRKIKIKELACSVGFHFRTLSSSISNPQNSCTGILRHTGLHVIIEIRRFSTESLCPVQDPTGHKLNKGSACKIFLQSLCGYCNDSKGTKTVDYRKAK